MKVMEGAFFGPLEIEFLFATALAVVIGFAIGIERETRHKAAGVSTHILVIIGSMLFSLMSLLISPDAPGQIAAQVVSGVGFLGAGLILKDGINVHNLTTAASVWFAAAIGMALGFGFYAVAIIAGIIAVFIPRIPSFVKADKEGVS
jgi:putative Mg2+ transporter-C (MgtC) family protein